MYELVFKFTIINLTYVHVKDFAAAFLTLKFVAMYLKLDRLLLQCSTVYVCPISYFYILILQLIYY